jgi:hypothetical protein
MNDGTIILEAKSFYGRKNVSKHGKEYSFVKIAEKVSNGNYLILIKSIKDNAKILVTLENDKDFIVRFN